MGTLFWLIILLVTGLALAYRRVDLKITTAALGAVLIAYTLVAGITLLIVLLWLAFAVAALLNVESLRPDIDAFTNRASSLVMKAHLLLHPAGLRLCDRQYGGVRRRETT